MKLSDGVKRIYDAVTLSWARKQGYEPRSTPKGPMLYDRATGKPILGYSGEALDDRFIRKVEVGG